MCALSVWRWDWCDGAMGDGCDGGEESGARRVRCGYVDRLVVNAGTVAGDGKATNLSHPDLEPNLNDAGSNCPEYPTEHHTLQLCNRYD